MRADVRMPVSARTYLCAYVLVPVCARERARTCDAPICLNGYVGV